MAGLIITPRTKVAELIEAYPELERLLVERVPAFEKLRNPVLRRTIARVTTLQHAASIGGVPIEELINCLRGAAGQDSLAGEEGVAYTTQQPAWFSEARVVAGLDAGSMLAAGEHPVGQVIADLHTLRQGDIYRLTAPFLPAPLVDKATSLGVSHWVTQQDDGGVVIYFCRL